MGQTTREFTVWGRGLWETGGKEVVWLCSTIINSFIGGFKGRSKGTIGRQTE